MANVLITGVAGLFGSHFSRHLLNQNHNVIGIDDLSGGYQDYIDERVEFHNFDLKDQEKVYHLFENNFIDYAFHFGAYAALGLSPFIRKYNYENNIISSVNIINACIKYNVKKLIFTSSLDVYGNNPAPYNESMIPMPQDPYGISKYAVEMDLKQAYNQFGLNYSIVRPHNIIGIYQNIWDKYRNVIGIWINKCIQSLPMLIYGDGEQKRAFSDIAFYMTPLEKLMSQYNDAIFNLGADQEYKLNEVAKIVFKIARKHRLRPRIQNVEPRFEVKDSFCIHDKAKILLDFEDKTDIEKTITEMFNWALLQPKRTQRIMQYEIDNRIYNYWK